MSAGLLLWAGRLADRVPIRWLGAGVLAGLALSALGMATVSSAFTLALALFGLRFFGQGMLTHVAMTAMGRWFSRKRGRAVAVAALGLPAGEALLPFAAVAAIGLVGWRSTWVSTAAVLAALAVPAFVILLKRERRPAFGALPPADSAAQRRGRDWTRGEVQRSPLFYALLVGVLAHPLVVTGIFFNQVGIVEAKGWQLTWWAASFPALALAHVLAALGTGWLVDRFGAYRLLPAALLPLGIATMILTFAEAPLMLPVFMALTGLAQGSLSTVLGALWPELYGSLHLGAIRALVVAAIVLSTALAPGVMGLLLDAGVPLQAQLLALALYSLAAAAAMAALVPRLGRLAGPRE
jgi:MFS family permease